MSWHVAQGATAAGKCKSRAEASSGTADRHGERPQDGSRPRPLSIRQRSGQTERMTQRLKPEVRLQGLLVDTVQMTS